MSKIIYNIVGKDNIEQGLLATIFTKEVIYGDIKVLHNPQTDMTLAMTSLEVEIDITLKEDIEEAIYKEVLVNEKDVIILNGYEISIEEVKDIYADIVNELDIVLCINTYNSSIPTDQKELEYSVIIDCIQTSTFTEEEWANMNEDINKLISKASIENKTEKLTNYDNDEDIQAKLDILDSLEDIDGYKTKYTLEDEYDELDIRTYKNITTISDGINDIYITNHNIDFIISSLSKVKANINHV